MEELQRSPHFAENHHVYIKISPLFEFNSDIGKNYTHKYLFVQPPSSINLQCYD